MICKNTRLSAKLNSRLIGPILSHLKLVLIRWALGCPTRANERFCYAHFGQKREKYALRRESMRWLTGLLMN